MAKQKILYVAGTRPNFMKIFPLLLAGKKNKNLEQAWIHTGQHYDPFMTSVFIKQFGLPKPKYSLKVGSGSHGQQTGRVLEEIDKILDKEKPDILAVVGDVNSTLASALAAAKKGILVAHVEAGLRSYDRDMPEEINRVLTDQISDFLLIPSKDAIKNLTREGIDRKKVHFVGNIMIDSLKLMKPQWDPLQFWKKLNQTKKNYFLLTLHRPSNVDQKKTLSHFLDILNQIQKQIPVVFPIHPRTEQTLKKFSLLKKIQSFKNVSMIKPSGYLETISLLSGAKGILTDSGGMQEESTILGVPCLTLRENTERPITVRQGTSEIVGLDKKKILSLTNKICANKWKKRTIPPLWDGKTAKRILKIFESA